MSEEEAQEAARKVAIQLIASIKSEERGSLEMSLFVGAIVYVCTYGGHTKPWLSIAGRGNTKICHASRAVPSFLSSLFVSGVACTLPPAMLLCCH